MAVTAVKLKDFQVHKILKITLDAGINTIVGPTDAGKSSVIRALRWACLNDLAGDAFVREGAKSVEVEVCFDKHRLERIKDRHNSYILDSKKFSSIAREVPRPIAQLLLTNEINFQSQHDGPFWFCESAPEVSRRLNAVVDLSVIDTALSNIASAVRNAQERKNVSAERVVEITQELEEVEGQEQRVEDFLKIKELNDTHEKAEADFSRLESLVEKVVFGRNYAQETSDQFEQLRTLGGLCKLALQLTRNAEALKNAIEEIEWRERAIEPPDFSSVENAFVQFSLLRVEWNRLNDALAQIVPAFSAARQAEQEANEAEEKFHAEVKGRICPLCNQKIL